MRHCGSCWSCWGFEERLRDRICSQSVHSGADNGGHFLILVDATTDVELALRATRQAILLGTPVGGDFGVFKCVNLLVEDYDKLPMVFLREAVSLSLKILLLLAKPLVSAHL